MTYTVDEIKAEAANLLKWDRWELGSSEPVPGATNYKRTAEMLLQMLKDYSAVRDEVIDALARANCRECKTGHKPEWQADIRHFVHVHEEYEIGCTSAGILRMKAGSPDRHSFTNDDLKRARDFLANSENNDG